MPAPTDNDFNVFYSIKDSDKFRIIKEYLWLDNTMAVVGRDVFPYAEDQTAQQNVSVVTRCYGFGGQNHGIFRRWGIADTVKDSDIKSFISKYPNGCEYDENGTEMYQFLKQCIDKRLESERAQRQREQAALEERRRIETEERRRQQAIEAEKKRYQEELRRQQEELRRQKEEEERKAREYEREQEEIKRRALSIAQEAEQLMSEANNYKELYVGIEKYRQAMEIRWKEPNPHYNLRGLMGEYIVNCIKKSDIYLGACEKAALNEYQNKNYPNVLKYCSYVCDLPQAGASETDASYLSFNVRTSRRTNEFHPEVICLTLMSYVYLSMNNKEEAIRVAEYGVQAGSIQCMEILGDHYSASSQKEDVLLSCYYFEMMGEVSDTSLLKKRKCAQDKVIAMRADEVEQVMNAYSPNWLPSPRSNTDTWETYSNLSNELLVQYDREPKNKDDIIVRPENAPNCFNRFGYVPGQIDLRILWDAYRTAHTQTTKKLLFLKKNEYVGELQEGDFVECCRYLWEKKYRDEMVSTANHEAQMFGQEPKPIQVEPMQGEFEPAEFEFEGFDFEPEIDEEQIRREKANEYFKQALKCKKNNDTQGMLKAYLEAVNYGSKEAANNLGVMYKNGNGVEKNLERAVSLFGQSAGQGNAIAMRNLAKCYLDGTGVEENFEKAIDLLTESAELGDAYSGLELVKIYGNWSHQDDNKRAYWLKKMADAGNVECMFDLGEFYAKNKEYLNEDEALKYYEKAAENGPDEMRLKVAKALDVLKYEGVGCVDLEAAKRWYCRVIEGTNDKLKLDAARGLDALYSFNGEMLREALDIAKAFDTYRLLGSNGNKEALAEAAYCKETGRGTEQDIDLAIAFYEQVGYEGQAEWCKKKRSGNMDDIAFLEHKDYPMPALIRDKHTCNNEYYLNRYSTYGQSEDISEYEGNIYYIARTYDMPTYLCISNNDGTDIRIIAELAGDYDYASVHVNITGIYVYTMPDYERLQIAHYDFSGELLSECKEEYPGGYDDGHRIGDLCFYDSKVYYVYSNEMETVKKAYIKCMDIDNHQVFTIYEKAAEIGRLFAIKEKLVFDASYENDDCEAVGKDSEGWMLLDLNTMATECISKPLCNPENVVDDPEMYDEESPRYNSGCSYDRNIVSFDFNRNIFWTEREVLEGEDSKHLKIILYREPKSLWGDRDTVISDLPIWRIPYDSTGGREYFDGIHRYFSSHYAVFESADINGESYDWSKGNGGHGECDHFKVLGESLFLNVAAYGEEQYVLSLEKSEPIRKSWFDKELDQEVIDAFNSKTRGTDSISDAISEEELSIPDESVFYEELHSDMEESASEEGVNSTFEEQKSNIIEGNETLGDLSVEKIIGNTDIKYNICTFGSKFHIGFGVRVTIEINGKTYECKTHNSAKGRIDGMRKLFAENDIKLGDCIEAYYYKDANRVVMVKK